MPAEGMWNSKLGNSYPREEIERMDQEHCAMLRKLRSKPENSKCCDCGSSDGMLWAVVNIGSFVCVKCASIHRGVGTHISKVKGLAGTYLWGPDEVRNMGGNVQIAQIYGGTIPGPDASEAVMRRFILDRYDRKCWYDAHAAAAQDVVPCAATAQQQVHIPTAAHSARSKETQQQKTTAEEPDFFNLLDFGADAAAPAAGQPKQTSLGGAEEKKFGPFDQFESAKLASQRGADDGALFRFDPFGSGPPAPVESAKLASQRGEDDGALFRFDPFGSGPPAPVAPVSEKTGDPKKQFNDSFDHFFDECLRDA